MKLCRDFLNAMIENESKKYEYRNEDLERSKKEMSKLVTEMNEIALKIAAFKQELAQLDELISEV